MSYCVLADILEQMDEDNLIQLTDDDDTGSVDASVVERAIADADAEIDAYCSSRYDVPFDTVPAIIRKISVDMAIYHLHRRHGAPPDRKERYDNAIKLLTNMAKGVVSIGASVSMVADSGAVASRAGGDRVFGNAGLEGY